MITIDNVSKWYGPLRVLTDCSTHVNSGEIVVVCGPSGSGKSTLIKCINGLENFDRGAITVNGISVGDRRTDLAKLRARIGMVFQSFELYPHMTVTENITLAPMKALGRSRDAATANWAAFRDDPEWKQVSAASEANGKLVEKTESTFLQLTDFSPKL